MVDSFISWDNNLFFLERGIIMYFKLIINRGGVYWVFFLKFVIGY